MSESSVGNLQLTVEMAGARIAEHELVGVIGNKKSLGSWNIQNAPLLKRSESDYNKWTTSVTVPLNKWVRYRYFIGALDKRTQIVQVRRWEVAERARELRLTDVNENTYDRFGFITPMRPKLRRAWLNTGHIVLLKLFDEALRYKVSEDRIVEGCEVVQLKVDALDAVTLQTLGPSARAHILYTKLQYGNSQLKDQPEFGTEYNTQTLIYHIYMLTRRDVGFLLKLFAFNKRNECVRLIAQSYLPPEALEKSEGVLDVTLISSSVDAEVANLEVHYLIINPTPNWHVKLNTTFTQYWPTRWRGLNIAHRGMGRSFVPNNPVRPPYENTVSSIKQAFQVGTDMVEFDVMLTKDLVPIIYHDFYVLMCPSTETPCSRSEIISVPVVCLTYAELQSMQTYKIVADELIVCPAPYTVSDEDERLFPTLQECFEKTKKMLGFNIEVKWPQELYKGGSECVQHMDKNRYVDTILDVVKRHSWGRVCFFSSFDADMCIMLRYKQNMYPVMLLIEDEPQKFADPRTHCLHPAINTAQAFDLNGIMPNVSMLHSHPDAFELVENQNKWLMLWGDELVDRAKIEFYRALGVNGLIVDHIDLLVDRGKRNIFESDEKLQQLFELQRSCGCR
ncbi:unnamed protein product [Ceratitis capitata]|uniref:(Mediterranean fruit fly) hypothetical protein n=1 Tax=Ceratitis capitata TaxID=7213 RepID=A0A811VDJ7_CERCA|nr:unnamed protein product [Ceratitis capitata]